MSIKETPLMKQYKEIKDQNQDSILFFRLGDFYEMFFDDAVIASKVLGLTLTSRNKEKGVNVPLAGIPYHSSKPYISKLVSAGYKVAICEQLENPKDVKGIVKRGVVQIITSGTISDIDTIDSKANNYLACLNLLDSVYSLSFVDITTGEFKVLECSEDNYLSEIYKLEPSELILTKPLYEKIKDNLDKIKIRVSNITKVKNSEDFLKEYFNIASLDSFGLYGKKSSIESCANILDYILSLHLDGKVNFEKIEYINNSNFSEINASTSRNLELIRNQREKNIYGSLLWVLDKCKTAAGSRKLKNFLNTPLLSIFEINKRQEDVSFLIENILIREELRENLENVYDLERLIGKIVFGNENAKDLIALKNTILSSIKIINTWPEKFSNIPINELQNIANLIEKTIVDDPPFSVREGGMIKANFNEELDSIRDIMKNGTDILLNIEARERENTGIKNLKIKYNKVFGYFIEITKSNINMIPDEYIRKQTVSNAERFITEEIKEYEDKIINSKARMCEMEFEILKATTSEIKNFKTILLELANILSYIDIIASFAITSVENNYERPILTEENKLEIEKGRHPVVEKLVGMGEFIPNDISFNEDNKFIILTGPNMSGKSTYMKQIALISIMAQIGCFVPAKYAKLPIIDKFLTRIGASDDIVSGQSTFMVEMSEVSNILNNATENSLIILDEVGRGTSTFDGLSIATAISEYIHNKISAKTIFATHYHELTELEEKFKNIVNYRIEVQEKNNKVLFLRTIVRGGADKSYGLEVAKLAGLPREILNNSKKILKKLESRKNLIQKNKDFGQMSLFDSEINALDNEDENEEIARRLEFLENQISEIKSIDINNLTPMKALLELNNIIDEINNYENS